MFRLLACLLGSAALAAQAPAQPDPEAVLARLRDAAQRLLNEERRALLSADGKPWDVPLRAASLGDDPVAHLAFVRDQIALEPYPGLQRGPSGTLVAKAGNPADRAYLLAELLRSRGVQARVVRAELSEDQAARMLEAALTAMRARKPEAVTPFGRGPLDIAKLAARCEAVGLEKEPLQGTLAKRVAERERQWLDVIDVTWRESRFLAEQLGTPTVPARDLHADAIGWLRRHYWVQVQGAHPDEWRDLDPSFPGLPPGASATSAEPEPIDPVAIADRLRFVVSMDRTVDGQPETVTLLDQEVEIPAMLQRPVRFMILPDRGYEAVAALIGSQDADKVRAAVAACTRFQAMLTVGSETRGSKVFDRAGACFAVAANGSLMSTAEKLQGVVDLFSGAAEAAAKTVLTGLRVRISSVREGVELWGRARDLSPATLPEPWFPQVHWSIFAHGQTLTSEFVHALTRSHTVRHAPAYLATLAGEPVPASAIQHYPKDLLHFARARHALPDVPPGAGFVFEHADVFMATNRVVLDEHSRLSAETGIDLIENGALIARYDERLQLDREATRSLGVFDTVAEQAVLRSVQGPTPSEGVLAPFERARLRTAELRVVDAQNAEALATTELVDRDREWIRQHAVAGEVALVARGESAAWWAYDPATGRTVGRIHGGRGGSAVRSEAAEVPVLLKATTEMAICLGVVMAKVHMHSDTGLDGIAVAMCFTGAFAGGVSLGKLEYACMLLSGLLEIGATLTGPRGG